MELEQLVADVADIALAAGHKILTVYEAGPVDVAVKDDASPLTEADRQSHHHIVAALESLHPRYPVLSEESDAIAEAERRAWRRYWLVDPLDGTKEFIKRNGEFTVNIALIDNGDPILGVVHVPVGGDSYLGVPGSGAWKIPLDGDRQEIQCARLAADGEVRVVASRSHRDASLQEILARIEAKLGPPRLVSMGSSLKICLLAEGRADLYPRLAPTSEWDTAAAHAVLSAAGGALVQTDFENLRYNQKSSLLNPHFLAIADPRFDWRTLLSPAFP